MKEHYLGYLYSLAPIHCGGEGDIGNISEIARESHTDFPYIPGSSLRGSIRDELHQINPDLANKFFGQELTNGKMGVHQVWFGDARLLWVPMRTLASQANGKDIFTWVSCHSLILDHALLAQKTSIPDFPNEAIGSQPGHYIIADAYLEIKAMSDEQKEAIELNWQETNTLHQAIQNRWEENRLVLPDSDFAVLMEHALWTQVRNRIQDEEEKDRFGQAEIFWTDVCIPRDTIFYYPWGYKLIKNNEDLLIKPEEEQKLINILQGLIQVGGQANVGRGWVKSWVKDTQSQTNTVPDEDVDF